MNSDQISEQIEELGVKIRMLELQLQGDHDLNTGLELQKQLSELEVYRTRLQSRLESVLAQESLAKKKREEDALDAELASIADDYAQTVRESIATVNKIALDLAPAVEREAENNDRSHKFTLSYEDVFLKRHDRWPELHNDKMRPQLEESMTPEGEIVAFALDLLINTKRGYGRTLEDVWRALRVTGS